MSRFEIRRRLGEGGFGVVFEAVDLESGALVAVKMLREPRPRALYHFKQEFRALAEFSHDNLVRLYELGAEDERWFFSMELVDGHDLLDWVHRVSVLHPASGRALASTIAHRTDDAATPTWAIDETLPSDSTPPSTAVEQRVSEVQPVDCDRLRDALTQIARGLAFLHERGKLHRDIKPQNVLVTRDGRVKLLDFGLVTDLGEDDEPGMMVGTPAYMAPEAMLGRAATPASDWYSVGVMLFEALTGRLPYVGESDWMYLQKSSTPRSPRELDPSVPEDLDRLCLALLDPDPFRRPSERQILESLSIDSQRRGEISGRWRFVGRTRELSRALESFAETARGSASIALIHGRSGIGKSALGEQLLAHIEHHTDDLLLLRGRCYAQESVPYKAFDAVVDTLARWLARQPGDEQRDLLPENALALARLFPVLHEVPVLKLARPLETNDALEIRRAALSALRDLLSAVSRKRRVVLFIDDLHWGDAESAVLANELFGGSAPPPIWLCGTYRTEEGAESELVQRLQALLPAHGCDLELHDLEPEEAETLAASLLGEEARARAKDVVREAGGSPFFIDELARTSHGARAASLDELIRHRLADLPAPARRLLEISAIAGQPLFRSVARRAADLDRGDAHELSLLRNSRFVRTRGSPGAELLETYHDRIRETVVLALPRDERTRLHARLADAFESLELGDAETLAVHHEAAGHSARAAHYLALAAEQSAAALAFERATRLFRKALTLAPDAGESLRRWRIGLGEALANLGRGRDAAEQLLLAADRATAFEALELRRRASELLMNAGHIERGLEVMRSVLERVGLRLNETPQSALAALLVIRAKLRLRGLSFVHKPEAELPPEKLLEADTCWSVASGLGIVDTVRGAKFQAQNLLLSLELGEPQRVARALAMEVAYASTAGAQSHARTTDLAKRTLGLSLRLNDPAAVARATLASAIAAFHEGRWRSAHQRAERASRLYRACTGVSFELHNADMYAMRSLYYLGDWAELVRRLPAELRDARERGDLFATTRLVAWGGYVADLLDDSPDRARASITAALEGWGVVTPHQQWYRLMAEVEIALFEADGPASHRLLEDEWPRVARSLQLRIQAARMIALHLRARAAISVIFSERRAARIAEECARAIVEAKSGWGDPLAELIRASLAAARRDTAAAIAGFERAEHGFCETNMMHYARAARWRRGLLLGGDEGESLAAACRQEWLSEGHRAPEKTARMLAP